MNKKALTILVLALTIFTGCVNPNNSNPYPSYPPSGGGYGGGYGNSGYYGNQYDRDQEDYYRAKEERRRLNEERRRLEDERERLAAEQRRQEHTRPPPPRERCPAGFAETNSKCTDKERKKGCRDIKMPSGLRCIDR